jgi:hypothetical protein
MGGLTFTIGQAIAIVAATGIATYATYDACVTQGGCDRLARDLDQALQQRQATVSSYTPDLRDENGLPAIAGSGAECVANSIDGDQSFLQTTQAIQNAEARLVAAEGIARNQLTILYRGTSLAGAYRPIAQLWTTPSLYYATWYTDFNAAADRSSPVIAIYTIPTVLLQGMVASGNVEVKFGGRSFTEYGFWSLAQRFLAGPAVIPVPKGYKGY